MIIGIPDKKTASMFKITVLVLCMTAISGAFFAQSLASPAITTVKIVNKADIGYASYYSYECANQPMANGKIFDPEKRTCASWYYPFGTVLIVKSLETGLATEVIVTDRGPNKRLVKMGRIIDLSKKAFEDISSLEKGLTKVSVTRKNAQNPA